MRVLFGYGFICRFQTQKNIHGIAFEKQVGDVSAQTGSHHLTVHSFKKNL